MQAGAQAKHMAVLKWFRSGVAVPHTNPTFGAADSHTREAFLIQVRGHMPCLHALAAVTPPPMLLHQNKPMLDLSSLDTHMPPLHDSQQPSFYPAHQPSSSSPPSHSSSLRRRSRRSRRSRPRLSRACASRRAWMTSALGRPWSSQVSRASREASSLPVLTLDAAGLLPQRKAWLLPLTWHIEYQANDSIPTYWQHPYPKEQETFQYHNHFPTCTGPFLHVH